MKKNLTIEEIESEPDQWPRIIMLVQYIIAHGSTEIKNRVEDVLKAATA